MASLLIPVNYENTVFVMDSQFQYPANLIDCENCFQLLALSEEHSQLYSSTVNFFSFSMFHLMCSDSLKQVLLTI